MEDKSPIVLMVTTALGVGADTLIGSTPIGLAIGMAVGAGLGLVKLREKVRSS